MRTPEEIIKRAKDSMSEFMDFESSSLLNYLTFEQAKPLLKEDANPKDWGNVRPLTHESVIDDMRDYMPFAWEKCLGHRGISAGRSVDRMRAWVWMLGEDDQIDWNNYAQYGAPILKQICERYGFPMPDSGDFQKMTRGEKCEPDCNGCGV